MVQHGGFQHHRRCSEEALRKFVSNCKICAFLARNLRQLPYWLAEQGIQTAAICDKTWRLPKLIVFKAFVCMLSIFLLASLAYGLCCKDQDANAFSANLAENRSWLLVRLGHKRWWRFSIGNKMRNVKVHFTCFITWNSEIDASSLLLAKAAYSYPSKHALHVSSPAHMALLLGAEQLAAAIGCNTS